MGRLPADPGFLGEGKVAGVGTRHRTLRRSRNLGVRLLWGSSCVGEKEDKCAHATSTRSDFYIDVICPIIHHTPPPSIILGDTNQRSSLHTKLLTRVLPILVIPVILILIIMILILVYWACALPPTDKVLCPHFSMFCALAARREPFLPERN